MAFIAFTGHRDKNTTIEALDELAELHSKDTWVHGGAEGFDTQVENYAKEHNIKTKVIRPDYRKYKDRPKYAPLARDIEIVEMSVRLYALYDGRDKGGTKFTVEHAQKIGIPVRILPIR